MIPIIMMIVGGILVLFSVFGLLAYLFEPLIKNFRIVIKREDDYAHYTSPENYAMLQNARRNYCIGLLAMFLLGFILLYAGAYLQFGERGFGFMFSTKAIETEGEVDMETANELSDRLDEDGNYVDEAGNVYSNYVLIKGDEVFFNDELIGTADEFCSYIAGFSDLGKMYIVDGYATSNAYHKVTSFLYENGFDYEPK